MTKGNILQYLMINLKPHRNHSRLSRCPPLFLKNWNAQSQKQEDTSHSLFANHNTRYCNFILEIKFFSKNVVVKFNSPTEISSVKLPKFDMTCFTEPKISHNVFKYSMLLYSYIIFHSTILVLFIVIVFPTLTNSLSLRRLYLGESLFCTYYILKNLY